MNDYNSSSSNNTTKLHNDLLYDIQHGQITPQNQCKIMIDNMCYHSSNMEKITPWNLHHHMHYNVFDIMCNKEQKTPQHIEPPPLGMSASTINGGVT